MWLATHCTIHPTNAKLITSPDTKGETETRQICNGHPNPAFHPPPGQQDSYHLQVPMLARNF